MAILSPILFALLITAGTFLFVRNLLRIRRNILLGRPETLNDRKRLRWKNVMILALGQKKMFRNIPVALMHLIIYVGFIVINIELLEIVLDGLLGTHRLFSDSLGSLYPFLINSFEILALLVILVCVFFLARRNILKLKRFISRDLDGWPRSDANYILFTEIVLMGLFLLMNAADTHTHFFISGLLQPLLTASFSPDSLHTIERTCWWLHIAGIMAFLNYLPYSKHLHILLAFPNAYYARLEPAGMMQNMEHVQNEVKYMMQPEMAPTGEAAPMKFGAKDATDLSWKSLLDAYSCTECGRCSTACPANQTGKKLSPRKIMMDTRDRLEEIGRNIDQNGSFVPDNKTLLYDYIDVESLRACTTCNACVQECPVSISPLDIILELRRSLIMEDSNAPQEWNGMFSNVENNFAPWKFSPEERDAWTTQA
jgi:heterodisulfide reductase subunit C